jgi:hypothetical protein
MLFECADVRGQIEGSIAFGLTSAMYGDHARELPRCPATLTTTGYSAPMKCPASKSTRPSIGHFGGDVSQAVVSIVPPAFDQCDL